MRSPLQQEGLWAARAGAVRRLLALVAVVATMTACGSKASTPPATPPHDYGAIRTRLGEATMRCGSAFGAPCGKATQLEFHTCTEEINTFLNAVSRAADIAKASDANVRALIHRDPPSGSQWLAGCGD
jgi:hypothetical protein